MTDVWYQRLWRTPEPEYYEEILTQTQALFVAGVSFPSVRINCNSIKIAQYRWHFNYHAQPITD